MLSVPDMAIVGALALILFGPDQLPKVARKVGSVMRDVQNTSQSFIREMERAADDHDIPHSNGTTHASPAYEPPAYEVPAYEPPVYDPSHPVSPAYEATPGHQGEQASSSAADDYGIPDTRR